MRPYGQYCPISRAAEILGDRWTINLVRDLLSGSTRFNDLARGNPRLSRALMSKRLGQLERAGIVEHQPDGSYRLTPAGADLRPVVLGLADWGARWAFGEPRADELDPDLLTWWLHQRLAIERPPRSRFVVQFVYTAPSRRYWIVIDDDGTSVCLSDPGFDTDVTVRTSTANLYRVYLGRASLTDEIKAGQTTVEGRPSAIRQFVRGFRQSVVADSVARGGER